MTNKTDFGFTQVDENDKQNLVNNVFHSVASKYDLMNDAMSLGIHRFWKHHTILAAGVKKDMHILDLASGTCDLAIRMGKKLAGSGRLVVTDINESMLKLGEDRMTDNGLVKGVEYNIVNAEEIPYADNSFDLVTMAFGLRNVTQKDKVIREVHRILKPGGKFMVLEFSKPTTPLVEKIYDRYSFDVLPKMGELIANDRESYQYLAESIRMHPNQERLKEMFSEGGFKLCKYQNLSMGIVALHQGIKL